MRASQQKTKPLGHVQAKVLRMCEMKPESEVLLATIEVAAARRLERRGLVDVHLDYFGVWCKVRAKV